MDFRVVRGRNDELRKVIRKVDELSVRWGLSLDKSDISGLYLASMLEVPEQKDSLRYIDVT
jgi:hypothetical protein